ALPRTAAARTRRSEARFRIGFIRAVIRTRADKIPYSSWGSALRFAARSRPKPRGGALLLLPRTPNSSENAGFRDLALLEAGAHAALVFLVARVGLLVRTASVELARAVGLTLEARNGRRRARRARRRRHENDTRRGRG